MSARAAIFARPGQWPLGLNGQGINGIDAGRGSWLYSWWARAGWVCGRRQKECCFSVARQLRGGSSIGVCERQQDSLVWAVESDVGVVLRVCGSGGETEGGGGAN
jgi:hypothetical protein